MTLRSASSILSAQDYNPFGEEIRSYLAGGTDDKYKFTGKERDKESGLDYFGARYYDSEVGRWLSVDPLAAKYRVYPPAWRGWSPYNYCLDNPLGNYDPDGNFPVSVHARIMSEVYGTDYHSNIVYNAFVDGPLAFFNSEHFDNFNSFLDFSNSIDAAGGFDELGDHTIGDFYAHSNYVDLWYSLYGDNDNMPSFEEIDWNSEFGQLVMSSLQSTVYPDHNDTDHGHYTGTRSQSKDHASYSDIKDLSSIYSTAAKYKLAINGYKKSLTNKKNKNKETEEQKRKREEAEYKAWMGEGLFDAEME
ncbi:MAG: RHS repeat-associated core domain-containing protein [Bacteroidota bacterium]|nr:RHS repeat-associated core domain-containing protein [Bacteroidota bacterium]